jgi:HK97 family phage major capsid protein
MQKVLRTRAAEVKSEMDEAFNSMYKTEDGGNVVIDPDKAKAFRALSVKAREITTELKGAGAFEEIEAFLATPAAGSVVSQPQVNAPRANLEGKSIGRRFIESEEFKGRDSGGLMRSQFELKDDLLHGLSGMESKDIYSTVGGTFTNLAFGTVEREPMVQRPYRSGRVRDLFPNANTTSNLIEYVRVLGYLDGDNNAAPVAERDGAGTNFALKPHTGLAFQPAQAPIRTIAHYEVAHRNTLDDEPQLQSIIDTELLYGLRLAEDDQLLNGDGTGENILGILRTPGIQEYPGSPVPTPSPIQPMDTYVDAVRRAATRVMLAYYEPTGVVAHPFDWENMETIKDANGNYIVAVNVAIGAEKRIWQMPVISTPAQQEGTALVGAFGLGAKVYDRQQSNIRVAEQHADLFLRNAVAILAEERVGMTVSRPESFIKIDLPASLCS